MSQNTINYVLNLDSKQFVGSLNTLDSALRGFERSTGRSNSLLREFGALITATGVALVTDRIFDAADAMTQLDRQLATMTNTLNNSGRETLKQGEILDFLYGTANETGTQIDVLTKSLNRMLPAAVANGIGFKDLQDTLLGVTGAMSLAGSTTEEKMRAFVAIGQVVGKNKLQMEELRGQLGEALPTAMLITADGLTKINEALGKTGEEAQVTISELNDLVGKGAIDGAKFVQALKLGTEAYVDFAKTNATLIESQFVRLSNVLTRRIGDLMIESDLNTLFAATLSATNDTLDKYLASMMGSADQFGRNFQYAFLDAIQGVGDRLHSIGPELEQVYSLASGFVSLVVDGWNNLPAVVREVGLIAGILFGVKGVAIAAAAAAGVGLLSKTWEDISKNQGDGIATMLGEMNHAFHEGTKKLIDGAFDVTDTLVDVAGRKVAQTAITSLESSLDVLKRQIEADQAELDQLLADSFTSSYAQLESKAKALEEEISGLQDKRAKAAKAGPDDAENPYGGNSEVEAITAKISEFQVERDKINDLIAQAMGDKSPMSDPKLAENMARIDDVMQRQAISTAKLAELTDDLARRKQELAATDAAQAQEAQQAQLIVSAQAQLERLERFHDDIRDIGEVGIDAARRIAATAGEFETLEEKALQASIALQKAQSITSQLNPDQQKGIKDLVEQMNTLGSATGEVRREFTTFNTAIDKIDDAMRSFDGSSEINSLLQQRAKELANAPSPDAEKKIAAHYDALALELRSRFFKIMFGGGETDAVQAALNAANVAADRIASIDSTPKNRAQLTADITARREAIDGERDKLAAMGIVWDQYTQKINDLNTSAAQAREDQANKALQADIARIQKRVELADMEYKAQEDALSAYIERQTKSKLFDAKAAEEKRKSKVGPYQTAAGDYDAVLQADSVAQTNKMAGDLIRLQVQLDQLNDAALRRQREIILGKQAEIDLTTQQQQIEYEASGEGRQAKIDSELLAASARQQAAEVELLVMNLGGYDATILEQQKTSAETRLRAAQAEYAANQDAGLRATLAKLEGQTAKDKLLATQAEIELKSTSGYQQGFVDQAAKDQALNAVELQNQLAAAQAANVLEGQRRVDQLQAQLDLQTMINEWTKPLDQQVFESFVGGLDSGISSLSQGITDAALGLQSFDDLFKNVLKTMISGLLEFFIQWGIRWAATEALQLAGIATVTTAHAAAQATQTATALAAQATQTSASVAAAGTTAAAWAPAAAATSVASYGTAALIGAAALAAIAATAATLFAVGKFHDGGVAGDEMMAKLQKGELVVPNSHSAMAYGVLSSMGVPFGQMGAASAMGGPSAPSISSKSVSTDFVSDEMISNMGQGGSTIINVFDMSEVDKHLSRNPGAIVNVVQNNKRSRGALSRND